MQGCVCVATLSAVLLVAHPFGLVGVGLAIVAVQCAAGAVSWWALRRGLYQQARGPDREDRWAWTGGHH